MKKKLLGGVASLLLISSTAEAQTVCNGPDLSALLSTDLNKLEKVKQEAAFARDRGGAEVYAYYEGKDLKVITASFKSDAGKADMNFFLKNRSDYLMEYHIIQNSNFFEDADSVVLTNEKSYYHICNNTLLTPAFGGIIDEEIYQNMMLVYEVILTEEAAE